MQSRSPLRMLVDLISSSVDAIEAQYSESKLDFPLLDNPIDPDDPRETLLYRPEIVQASALITSACEQLVATCQQPFVSVFSSAAAVSDFTFALGGIQRTYVFPVPSLVLSWRRFEVKYRGDPSRGRPAGNISH